MTLKDKLNCTESSALSSDMFNQTCQRLPIDNCTATKRMSMENLYTIKTLEQKIFHCTTHDNYTTQSLTCTAQAPQMPIPGTMQLNGNRSWPTMQWKISGQDDSRLICSQGLRDCM